MEAKLVTRTGLALSVRSEFVENVPRQKKSDERYEQDGQLKALPRLLAGVKQAFPGLALCLLLDSLHGNGPTFRLCRANDWRFLITLKQGALPSVYEKFEALKAQRPENALTVPTPDGELPFAWVNAIACQELPLNVLERRVNRPNEELVRFLWVTDILVTHELCQPLSPHGGRQRWRIENEGFRAQKHAGFEMEHAYAPSWTKPFRFAWTLPAPRASPCLKPPISAIPPQTYNRILSITAYPPPSARMPRPTLVTPCHSPPPSPSPAWTPVRSSRLGRPESGLTSAITWGSIRNPGVHPLPVLT